MSQQLYYSYETLKEMTGYKTTRSIISWLNKNDINYLLGKNGLPFVPSQPMPKKDQPIQLTQTPDRDQIEV